MSDTTRAGRPMRFASVVLCAAALAALTIVPACGGDGGDGALSDFEAVSRRFAENSFTGTYTLTAPDGQREGTLVWYKDGDRRFRFDLKDPNAAAEEATTSIIETEDLSVVCLEASDDIREVVPGGEDAAGFCFDSPGGASGTGAGFIEQLRNDVKRLGTGEVTVLETESRQIIGQDATCYRVREQSGQVTVTCLTGDGLLLQSDTEGAESMTATAIDDGVSDSDFDLPYERRPIVGNATPVP